MGSPKEEHDISYHEIRPKQQKRFIFIYIYMKMKIERETNKYEIGNSMISMKYYIAKKKKKTIFHIMRYIQNSKNDIYIYIQMEIEREIIKYEIGNFKKSMKYYIAKRRRRYFKS